MRLYIKLIFIVILIFFFLWISCSPKSVHRQYFILDYRPVLQDSTLKIKQPLPYKVQVRTMKIPRTFDRVGIVVRYSTHQLDYYRYQLWAIRPQIIISDLITRHISNYRVFQSCQREFLEERPDFEIIGVIDAIEKFDNEAYTAAHLAMKLYLRTYDSYENILSHEFDREEEMPLFRMELFAKKLSDILREEVDIFIEKMVDYFDRQNESETKDEGSS